MSEPTESDGTVRTRRPQRLLLGLWLVALLLGAGTQGSATEPGATDAPAGTVTNRRASTPEGRLIDLSGLGEERRTTVKRSLPLSLGIATGGLVAVLGGAMALLYNGLVSSREQVNAGWAQVENVYQRRLDLVPLLVDAVQTYTEHERETLTAVTQARAEALQARGDVGGAPPTVDQLRAIEAAQGRLDSALTRLLAVVENYPDLKASRNFLSLQDQIEGTENRVAIERRNYNEMSRRYNTRLQVFPANLVAATMGFEAKPYFQAEEKALEGLDDPFGRRGI